MTNARQASSVKLARARGLATPTHMTLSSVISPRWRPGVRRRIPRTWNMPISRSRSRVGRDPGQRRDCVMAVDTLVVLDCDSMRKCQPSELLRKVSGHVLDEGRMVVGVHCYQALVWS